MFVRLLPRRGEEKTCFPGEWVAIIDSLLVTYHILLLVMLHRTGINLFITKILLSEVNHLLAGHALVLLAVHHLIRMLLLLHLLLILLLLHSHLLVLVILVVLHSHLILLLLRHAHPLLVLLVLLHAHLLLLVLLLRHILLHVHVVHVHCSTAGDTTATRLIHHHRPISSRVSNAVWKWKKVDANAID